MLTCLTNMAQLVHSVWRQLVSGRGLLIALLAVLMTLAVSSPAYAIDAYVKRYLKATEPVTLELNGKGETAQFSPEELSEGKELFEAHCINCHVGGATLPDPSVSLALDTLAGANPPRDNIDGLVAFLRNPMTYDGQAETFWCRQVPESWMPQEQVEKLAAFVLRAAQKAPGWGTEEF